MEDQIKILDLADYYEQFEVGDCRAYLIINQKIKDYPAMFGFVSLSQDFSAVKDLFDRMEDRARQMGYSHLIGPLNYSTWMSYRWAISRFDLQLFPDCNNPDYYNHFIQKLAYQVLYTYRSAVVDMNNPLFAQGQAIYRAKCREGYSFKTYDSTNAYGLAQEIYHISKDAFADAYLYSDIPFEVFSQLYLSWIKNLDFSLIVAYDQDQAVGYVFGYENPLGPGFISKTSAVKKAYQKHKIYTALLYLGANLVMDKGYQDMIYHFQCEQKPSFRKFDETIESNEKRYAIYVKEL